jgi:taurine dioxygenase
MLSPALGVEVSGIDLARPLEPHDASLLRLAFAEHHLLLLRDQEIDEAQQLAFATLFGPVSHRGAYMKQRDFTHVSNVREDGILGGGVLHFHSDHTFFRHPLRAICLYAIEVPDEGGDTLFSNVAMAYDLLPDAMKAKLENRRSLQLFDYTGDYNRRTLAEDAPADAPRCWHPLTREDDAGRTVLFMHAHTTAAIEGMAHDEVDTLIEGLVDVIADPAIGYRHRWRPGDVIIWNNITLQHARTDFDPGQARTLRRVPIAVSEAEARDETATAA